MPDIGMIELILIGIVGFLVLGPERLPSFLSQVAKIVREGRMWLNNLKMQLDQEKQHLAQPLQQVKEEMETSVQAATSEVSQVKEEVEIAVQPVTHDAKPEKKDK
ncbi:MAG: Sec-independent protein translocase protein TatB [Ghiorsea sp.]|nr:Sec-independent protein translocase protein TatB [Ghiorsea sp.]